MSLLDVFVAIFWFMFLLTWVLMLISIFRDIFSDHQLSGGAKALWSLLLIAAPWLGTLIYLVARGGSMHERAVAQSQFDQRALGDYVRGTAPASAAAANTDGLTVPSGT